MSSSRKSLSILVAPNAFKESLSAMDAAAAISRGLLRVLPNSRIKQLPIADGGDGTLEAVVEGTHGKIFPGAGPGSLGKEDFCRIWIDGRRQDRRHRNVEGIRPGPGTDLTTQSHAVHQLRHRSVDPGRAQTRRAGYHPRHRGEAPPSMGESAPCRRWESTFSIVEASRSVGAATA